MVIHPPPLAETRTGNDPAMKNLAHWFEGWPTLFGLAVGTLAYGVLCTWLKEARSAANREECGHAPTRKHVYATLPTDDWCSAHDTWFDGSNGQECPACRLEWEQVWTLTEEDEQRRDDWTDQQEERAQADDWYQNLIDRAQGNDPHNGWRAL